MRARATTYTSSPFASATYSCAGCTAIARFAGKVHGVVVQITAKARRLPSTDWSSDGTDVIGNLTQTDGVLWSSYSTSACASAVRQCMHQWTGFRPL